MWAGKTSAALSSSCYCSQSSRGNCSGLQPRRVETRSAGTQQNIRHAWRLASLGCSGSGSTIEGSSTARGTQLGSVATSRTPRAQSPRVQRRLTVATLLVADHQYAEVIPRWAAGSRAAHVDLCVVGQVGASELPCQAARRVGCECMRQEGASAAIGLEVSSFARAGARGRSVRYRFEYAQRPARAQLLGAHARRRRLPARGRCGES